MLRIPRPSGWPRSEHVSPPAAADRQARDLRRLSQSGLGLEMFPWYHQREPRLAQPSPRRVPPFPGMPAVTMYGSGMLILELDPNEEFRWIVHLWVSRDEEP